MANSLMPKRHQTIIKQPKQKKKQTVNKEFASMSWELIKKAVKCESCCKSNSTAAQRTLITACTSIYHGQLQKKKTANKHINQHG